MALNEFWSKLGPKRPERPPLIEDRLQLLCAFPTAGSTADTRISEQKVREISLYLRELDNAAKRTGRGKWSSMPRTYSILRNINMLSAMDTFIERSLYDIHLPWTEETLPKNLFIGIDQSDNDESEIRKRFLNVQGYYLTEFDVQSIENGGDHQCLGVKGDTFYEGVRFLGQGGFGEVHAVTSRLSRKCFARKRVARGRDNEYNERRQKALIQELQFLKNLGSDRHHRHLVKITGSYTDSDCIAYLMEPVADGTLERFLNLKSRDTLFMVRIRRFYGCLASAIHHLHHLGIRHRDLTSRNILIKNENVYISDFGSAYEYAHPTNANTRHMNPPISFEYMAPEIANYDERGNPSDMWSLGVIFLEMTTLLHGRTLSELKQHTERAAGKHKKPYYYANILAVQEWLNKLSKKRENYDNEPVLWTKDLLQQKPEERKTARNLMKAIKESSSFNVFSCCDCVVDFDDVMVVRDDIAPKHVSEQGDAATTMETVHRLFNDSDSAVFQSTLSHRQTHNINEWRDQLPATDEVIGTQIMPGSWNDGNGIDILFDQPQSVSETKEPYSSSGFLHDESNSLAARPWTEGFTTRLWDEQDFYNAYSYIADDPQYVAVEPENITEGLQPKDDINWQELQPVEQVVPKSENFDNRCKVVYYDLGFDEYDDESSRPYDEFSDRSDEISQNPMDINCTDSVSADELEHDGLSSIQMDSWGNMDAINPKENNKLPFEEDFDESESEIPDNPLQDSENPNPRELFLPQCSKDTTSTMQTHYAEKNSQSADGASTKTPNLTPELLVEEIDLLVMQNNQNMLETEPVGQAMQTSHGAEQLGVELANEDMETQHHAPEPIYQVSQQTETRFIWVSREPADDAASGGRSTHVSWSTGPPETLAPQEHTEGLDATKQNHHQESPKKPTPSRRKSSQNLGGTKVGPGETSLPTIKVHPPNEQVQPKSKLSKAGIKALNQMNDKKEPRVPKKRDKLQGLDVPKMFDEFNDLASSIPTSVITENTRKRLSSLLFVATPTVAVENELIKACKNGKSSAVKYILNNGRLAKASRRKHRAALIHAIQGGSRSHNKCVRNLIAYGVDLSVRSSKTGMTPLHTALDHTNFKGYHNLIWLLVDPAYGSADPNIPDLQGHYPITKILSGSDSGPLEKHKLIALSTLLKANAEVNIKLPGSRNTPLHLAVGRQDHFAVAMLLYKEANVNVKNSAGTTPLHITANQFRGDMTHNHAMVLDLLLHSGANVNEQAGSLNRSALHWAVTSGTPQAVEMLLNHKASIDLQDENGCGAMMLAVQWAGKLTNDRNRDKDIRLSDHVEVMSLLNKGGKYKWPMKKGRCPVEIAIQDGDIPLLEKLLAYKLDIEAPFKDGITIKSYAEKEGTSSVNQLLVPA